MNRNKRKLSNSIEPALKRQREENLLKIPFHEDLKLNMRQNIIIKPQYESVLPNGSLLLLKGIIASKTKGKILDIIAPCENMEKFQNLNHNNFYLIHNVFITWRKHSKRKIGKVDRHTGIIKQLKEEELEKYGQKLNLFKLEFDESKIVTNYNEDNIQNFQVAGCIDSEPFMKREGLYTFWIKNPNRLKILVNYWAKKAPPIVVGKIFIFTSVRCNYYLGIKSLTINGPFYVVPWEWNFNGTERNASSKIVHNAES